MKCCALICVVPFVVSAQSIRTPVAAPYLGLGAYATRNIDVFSGRSNQACLANLKHASAGVFGERRFLLNELGLYSAALAILTSSGNFALNLDYFGFSEYNESNMGFAYARSLGEKVDVGTQFNYYAVRIAGYGSASAINFELGVILHLTDKLNAGLHMYNPTGSRLGTDKQEKLPSVYAAGIGFEPSETFFLSLEIIKEQDEPPNVNAGFQYRFLPQLMARAGISAATSMMYIGIGFQWKSMRLDATASYHQQLGVTPGLLLAVSLVQATKKKETSD